MKILFNNPSSVYNKYKKEINSNIAKVLKSGVYIKSKELQNFETNFSKYINSKYSVGVGNATDAIYISLKSLNIKKGDEVITVSHTATGTIMAILNTGATPILCDINKIDYNIDIDDIEKKITSKTKAIVVVHLYGQSCDLYKLLRISKKYNLFLIEDCSQSAGAKYKNKHLGTFGTFGCFSFFPTKNLSCIGDGGMIVSNNAKYKNKILALREYGWDNKRNATYVGINSRLDELQASILSVKLKYLDKDNTERRKIANYYRALITNSKITHPVENAFSYHVYHLYVIRVKQRDKLIKLLNKHNIFPGIHYIKANHQQKLFQSMTNNLPKTENIVKEILSLPIYPGLLKKDILRIVNLINNF